MNDQTWRKLFLLYVDIIFASLIVTAVISIIYMLLKHRQ